jgi:hypothetical protein
MALDPDVRLGSKAEVRFTLERRRQAEASPCPLSAMCGRFRVARRIFTPQAWSVQPCVRPLSAVHVTAGHNALRGSGPGQKPAFDDAMALVGCPDRRIDGSALRAVRPPNFHIAPNGGTISLTPQVRRVLCRSRPWPLWPRPSWRSCWPMRWRQPWSVAALTMQ